MIKLPAGGTASLTLDLSYFPRLNGLEGTEKLVEDFKDFIAPMLISPLINSCHSQLTLVVHSSVLLPAGMDGVTWKCRGILMTLFPSELENCSKYAEEETHHHYICKVSMELELESSASLEIGDIQNLTIQPEMEGRLAEIILPEDVWRVILEKVKDPQDRFSCYNTCKLFKRILGISALFGQSFPNLFLHLEKSDVLNLRKVSSEWKQAVDYHLKHHESLRPPTANTLSRWADSKAFFKKWLEFNGSTYTFRFSGMYIDADENGELGREQVTEDQVCSFWRRWMKLMSLKTPLLTGLLHLSIPGTMVAYTENPIGERWEKAFDVLGKLGPHILYLKITIWPHHCYFVSGRRIYDVAQVALSLCPNLRKIIFDFRAFGEETFSTEAISTMPLPNHLNLEAVEVAIKPHFENFNSHGPRPLLFLKLILEKYSMQLGKVSLNTFYEELRLCEFPRVSHFRVKTNGMTMLTALTTCKMPNLKKLSLYYNPGAECPLKSILEVLNVFSTTSNLKIEFAETINKYQLLRRGLCLQELETLPPQLSALPGLKILEFCHSKQLSYNFISRFPGLRVLHIFQKENNLPFVVSRNDLNLGVESVDLYEILERDRASIPNSNVWRIVPSLQEITYRDSQGAILKWSRES